MMRILKNICDGRRSSTFPDSNSKEYVIDSHRLPSLHGTSQQAFMVAVHRPMAVFLQSVCREAKLKLNIIDIDHFSAEKTLLVNYPEILEHDIALHRHAGTCARCKRHSQRGNGRLPFVSLRHSRGTYKIHQRIPALPEAEGEHRSRSLAAARIRCAAQSRPVPAQGNRNRADAAIERSSQIESGRDCSEFERKKELTICPGGGTCAANGMRIIAGTFRGRKLLTLSDLSIRPTTDRVKQTVFDILSNRIDLNGVEMLDLFSGSGSLGSGSISRGAKSATFIEKSPRSLAVLQQNVDTLGCGGRCTDVPGRCILVS